MRVLILCNKSPWPPKDGGAAATLNLINGLSAQKVSVTVLAMNTVKHFVRKEDIPETLYKTIDYHLINVDTRVNPIKLIFNLFFSAKPYNLERFWSRTYENELKKIIRSDFDIIQFEGLAMLNYLPVIRKCTAVPLVFRAHNIENKIWHELSREVKNPVKSLYFRVLSRRIKKVEKDVLQNVDAVVPISKIDLSWMVEEGLYKPAQVIMPGYDPEKIGEYSESNTQKVYFIGALDWQANIYGLKWFLKHVWPNVIKKIPHSELIIAGRNASAKTISLFKGPNISYVGEVESSEDFMKNMTLMIVPLFSGSGIRMKIIEGMSLGKSIVATPLATEGIECEEGKEIFVATDAESFTNKIVRLLTNDELLRETGKNAILFVRKNYNTLASSEKLINFYRDLTA